MVFKGVVVELIDADKSYKSKKYRYYVLGIFSVTYMFNFVDRQILAILQDICGFYL